MGPHPVLELHRKLKAMRLLNICEEDYEDHTSATFTDWALEIDRVEREVIGRAQRRAAEEARRGR